MSLEANCNSCIVSCIVCSVSSSLFSVTALTRRQGAGSCLADSTSSARARASCVLWGAAICTTCRTSVSAMASMKKPTAMMSRASSGHPSRYRWESRTKSCHSSCSGSPGRWVRSCSCAWRVCHRYRSPKRSFKADTSVRYSSQCRSGRLGGQGTRDNTGLLAPTEREMGERESSSEAVLLTDSQCDKRTENLPRRGAPGPELGALPLSYGVYECVVQSVAGHSGVTETRSNDTFRELLSLTPGPPASDGGGRMGREITIPQYLSSKDDHLHSVLQNILRGKWAVFQEGQRHNLRISACLSMIRPTNPLRRGYRTRPRLQTRSLLGERRKDVSTRQAYHSKCNRFRGKENARWATVAEQLVCSPPTEDIWVHSPAGSLRIFASGNRAGRCCWSAGFLGDLPFPPPFRSGVAPYSPQSPSLALNTSMLRAVQISSLTKHTTTLKKEAHCWKKRMAGQHLRQERRRIEKHRYKSGRRDGVGRRREACSSQSDTRHVPRASRSRSERKHAPRQKNPARHFASVYYTTLAELSVHWGADVRPQGRCMFGPAVHRTPARIKSKGKGSIDDAVYWLVAIIPSHMLDRSSTSLVHTSKTVASLLRRLTSLSINVKKFEIQDMTSRPISLSLSLPGYWKSHTNGSVGKPYQPGTFPKSLALLYTAGQPRSRCGDGDKAFNPLPDSLAKPPYDRMEAIASSFNTPPMGGRPFKLQGRSAEPSNKREVQSAEQYVQSPPIFAPPSSNCLPRYPCLLVIVAVNGISMSVARTLLRDLPRTDERLLTRPLPPFYLLEGRFVGEIHSGAVKIPLPPRLKPHPAILSGDRGADAPSEVVQWQTFRFASGGGGGGGTWVREPVLPGAAVAERLDCSHHTKVNRVQSPAGSLRIFASGNCAGRCRWSAGFLGDLPFPPSLHSDAAPFSLHFTLIVSQNLVVKSHTNLSTQPGPAILILVFLLFPEINPCECWNCFFLLHGPQLILRPPPLYFIGYLCVSYSTDHRTVVQYRPPVVQYRPHVAQYRPPNYCPIQANV
ncbi:hypothetical protein PR048_027602 [Dryococelus australis]|uniref:Uncharacterized protein n=1 Tax=Dryococelus australis TaxID=614101 RepID=A0ABQ9GGZ8_9NEOP|nr:hypothetical protein PR048_027602 [Dryococelus australis]